MPLNGVENHDRHTLRGRGVILKMGATPPVICIVSIKRPPFSDGNTRYLVKSGLGGSHLFLKNPVTPPTGFEKVCPYLLLPIRTRIVRIKTG